MKLRISLLSAIVVSLLHAAPASAQEAGGLGLGVGVQAMLTGSSGASLTYDAGAFHIDGIFGLNNIGNTAFVLGGRFYYTLHSRSSADLSIGGGFAIVDDGSDTGTDFDVEAGAKIRVFLVPNVAFSAVVGLGLVIEGDDNQDDLILINGQLTGGLGLTYFFQ